jgi:hypothetical protein
VSPDALASASAYKKKPPSRCRGKVTLYLKKGSMNRITPEPEKKLKTG